MSAWGITPVQPRKSPACFAAVLSRAHRVPASAALCLMYGAIFEQGDNLPTASGPGPWHRALAPPWGPAGVNSALHDVSVSPSLTQTLGAPGAAKPISGGPICLAIFVRLAFMLRSPVASGLPRCIAACAAEPF